MRLLFRWVHRESVTRLRYHRREPVLYDSFEGMPPPDPRDQYANPMAEGFLKAEIEQVRENVRRHGVIQRCTFVKGFFSDTLPHHEQPVVLCFLDVDFQASLHDCVLNLWPHLTEKGYLFIDEYVFANYCALFYSDTYWRKYFDAAPRIVGGRQRNRRGRVLPGAVERGRRDADSGPG